MENILLEKLIEIVKDIFSSEDDDEIIYPINEYEYNNDYNN